MVSFRAKSWVQLNQIRFCAVEAAIVRPTGMLAVCFPDIGQALAYLPSLGRCIRMGPHVRSRIPPSSHEIG